VRLKGKVVIVTGGGKGIGRGIAFGLASEGAKIVVTAINASVSQHKSDKIGGYTAAKKVVEDLKEKGVEAIALEVAKKNITVNAICPGVVDTQMHRKVANAFRQPGQTEEESYNAYTTFNIPQGVPQTPEDMAEAVIFLAVSDHVTGQAICVDGGTTI
jgi:NAD(P)-dependent dehydrogenase (short-subunit alcohol dehydrogenase family)